MVWPVSPEATASSKLQMTQEGCHSTDQKDYVAFRAETCLVASALEAGSLAADIYSWEVAFVISPSMPP